MRVVVGLGNLGKRYELTRHNVGFLLLDYVAEKFSLIYKTSRQNYYSAKGSNIDLPFILVKPTTYMNLSGVAVFEVMRKFKISIDNLLVLQDDIDLELGKVKIKQSGSSGGHNGISSIIEYLDTNRFSRVRIGIGKEFKKGEMVDYVLDKFTGMELEILKNTLQFGYELVEKFIVGGNKMMLDYFSMHVSKN